MDRPPSNRNLASKFVVYGVVFIQLFDTTVHVATNQVEPLRIASNLVILGWASLLVSNVINTNIILATRISIFVYLACNLVFLFLEGLTNPNRGGEFRTVLFVLVGSTVGLCIFLANGLRKTRGSPGEEP